MCTVSVFEARNKLSDYVKLAEEGEPVAITRYNKPVAVIISYDEFEVKKNNKPTLMERLQKLKEEYADVIDNEGIPEFPKVYLDPNRKIFED